MTNAALPEPPTRRTWITLAIVISTVALIRLPFMVFGPGMQDENWYSVPGWTVANEGIPRMPYVPVEDRESVFYRSHDVLFALPPAFFYAQAPFFLLLPDSYTTARIPSWIAGMMVLYLLFVILRRMRVRNEIGIATVAICGMSRPFFFAWTNARPDMLCAAFGIAAMLWGLKFLDTRSRRSAVLAGLFVGLGLLSHPFGIVFAFQLAVLMLFLSGDLKWTERVFCLTIAGATAAAALALWIPLILVDPEAFWLQFSNNVLSRSGPGLPSRLLWPWSALGVQANLFLIRNGSLQSILCVLAIASAVGLLIIRRDAVVRRAVALMLTALYLHLASVGTHNLVDYWCYTWVWICVVVAVSIETLATSISQVKRQRVIIAVVMTMLLISLVPGGGLRTCWVYLSHYPEVEYNRSEFCRVVNDRLPPNTRLLVAADYVFEFEVLGREPVNASRHGMYQDVGGLDFDYWVASRSNTLEGLPQSLGCKKLWSFGHWDDSLSCYVDIYAAPEEHGNRTPWPR